MGTSFKVKLTQNAVRQELNSEDAMFGVHWNAPKIEMNMAIHRKVKEDLDKA